MVLLTTKYSILLVFHSIMAYHKKTYCWPTRAKIQELIHKKTGRLLSLSWIDDCLYWLKQNKYIKSYRNYGRYDDGTVYSKASNRQLTKKGLLALTKGGLKVARFLWSQARNAWRLEEPNTATQEKPLETQEKPPLKVGENPFLSPGHRRRLGLPDALPFDPEKA